MAIRRLSCRRAQALIGIALACVLFAVRADPSTVPAAGSGFPRLMGMNIGAKHYQDPDYQQALSRLDVVILGFYRGWRAPGGAVDSTTSIRNAVKAIKARHPGLLVGQYTVLNEARDDPGDPATRDLRDKLDAAGWWLRDAAGHKVQWTSLYSTWEINFTEWAKPDAGAMRWPQWLAQRNYAVFFRDVPEFDIVYLDNVMSAPRVSADWNLDGHNDNPRSREILAAHRAGHLAYWRRLRTLMPNVLLIGNVDGDLDNPAWRGQLDGAFLEGMIGRSWSIEAREGWPAMMARYRAVMANVRAPAIVGFNVSGAADDFRLFRYAYASCLLDDGYFSYTDEARGYSSVPWFDEYDYRLGRAVSPPPATAWRQGVWRRDFERGTVLVNPTPEARTVTLEAGFRRLAGQQDAAVNDGSVARRVTLAARDGIVLRATAR